MTTLTTSNYGPTDADLTALQTQWNQTIADSDRTEQADILNAQSDLQDFQNATGYPGGPDQWGGPGAYAGLLTLATGDSSVGQAWLDKYNKLQNLQATATQLHSTLEDNESTAVTAMQAQVAVTQQGADAAAAADQAAASVSVDTDGMSVSQMVMLVFGAANQAREDLAKDQLDDLNDKNQDVARLTSLMSSVRAAIPSDTTQDGTVPQETLDALKAAGVAIPGSDGSATQFKGSDMSTLVENIKSSIDTLNSTQTLQLQSVTKINNDLSEGTQLIASTLSDAHQMDMGIIKS